MENRLLIHTPTGKDGRLIEGVLQRAGLQCHICSNPKEVVEELSRGAGAVILADEALTQEFVNIVSPFLQKQENWSDLPFLILRQVGRDTPEIRSRYLSLGNITLLERPVRTETLINVGASALRARKRQYDMRETEHRKDEFLAMLAHELRNPLAPISAASALLKIPNLAREKIQDTSDIISRQVRHMTGLVDDLLDVSRVSRGLVTLNKTTTDSANIVASAVEQARPLLDSRNHRLTIKSTPDTAFICADQKRLVQIIANVLNNAAKYTPPAGEILLSVDIDDLNVTFTIEDSGIGMDAHVLERVFDMFAQAERSLDRSQGGLGIGLALVRSLVNLHEGKVAAFSEGIGKGSKFIITLPRTHNVKSTASTAMPEIVPALESHQLLVVDDNVDAANMLAMYLEISGFKVAVEHTAEAALQRVATETPVGFLLDIGLPDMDGSDLARTLRKRTETANSLMIAITGYGQNADRQKSLDAGFDYHFVKPVDMPRLLGILSTLKT